MTETTKHTLQLFPTVVNVYDTDINTADIYNLIVDQIKNGIHAHKKTPDLWQSNSAQDQYAEILAITDFIIDCVQDYSEQYCWDIKKEDWYIADCWWTASTGTSSTHFSHIHANSLISAVFYVNMPKGAGSLLFPHPQITMHSLKPETTEWNIINSVEYKITPKKGTCVVFKSNTPHMVDNNATSDLRVSLAFTLNVKNLGKNSHLARYEER
jgi:uncharacterized protein (TIGR02466 family)